MAGRNTHIEAELNHLKCQQTGQAQWNLDTKTNELSSMQQMRDQLSAVRRELNATVDELSATQQQRTADAERFAQLEKQYADILD